MKNDSLPYALEMALDDARQQVSPEIPNMSAFVNHGEATLRQQILVTNSLSRLTQSETNIALSLLPGPIGATLREATNFGINEQRTHSIQKMNENFVRSLANQLNTAKTQLTTDGKVNWKIFDECVSDAINGMDVSSDGKAYLLVQSFNSLRGYIGDLNIGMEDLSQMIEINRQGINFNFNKIQMLQAEQKKQSDITKELKDFFEETVQGFEGKLQNIEKFTEEKLFDIKTDLGEEARQRMLSDAQLMEKINKMREHLITREKQSRQHTANMEGLDGASQFFKQLASVTNSDRLYKVATVVQAGFQVAKAQQTLATMAKEGISGLALLSPYAMIGSAALSLLGLFGGKNKSDQGLMKQLKALSAQIATLRREVHGRFDILEEKLAALYNTMLMGLDVILLRLQKQDDKLQQILKEEFQHLTAIVLQMEKYLGSMGQANYLKEIEQKIDVIERNDENSTFYTKMGVDEFRQYHQILCHWLQDPMRYQMLNGSMYLTSAPHSQTNFSPENIKRALDSAHGAESLGYLSQYLHEFIRQLPNQRIGQLHCDSKILQATHIHPYVWLRIAQAYVKLCHCTPQHRNQRDLKPQDIQKLVRSGEDTRNFVGVLGMASGDIMQALFARRKVMLDNLSQLIQKKNTEMSQQLAKYSVGYGAVDNLEHYIAMMGYALPSNLSITSLPGNSFYSKWSRMTHQLGGLAFDKSTLISAMVHSNCIIPKEILLQCLLGRGKLLINLELGCRLPIDDRVGIVGRSARENKNFLYPIHVYYTDKENKTMKLMVLQFKNKMDLNNLSVKDAYVQGWKNASLESATYVSPMSTLDILKNKAKQDVDDYLQDCMFTKISELLNESKALGKTFSDTLLEIEGIDTVIKTLIDVIGYQQQVDNTNNFLSTICPASQLLYWDKEKIHQMLKQRVVKKKNTRLFLDSFIKELSVGSDTLRYQIEEQIIDDLKNNDNTTYLIEKRLSQGIINLSVLPKMLQKINNDKIGESLENLIQPLIEDEDFTFDLYYINRCSLQIKFTATDTVNFTKDGIKEKLVSVNKELEIVLKAMKLEKGYRKDYKLTVNWDDMSLTITTRKPETMEVIFTLLKNISSKIWKSLPSVGQARSAFFNAPSEDLESTEIEDECQIAVCSLQ